MWQHMFLATICQVPGLVYAATHKGQWWGQDEGKLAADAYHRGEWKPDPDEQRRVNAYFAELDRRRANANK